MSEEGGSVGLAGFSSTLRVAATDGGAAEAGRGVAARARSAWAAEMMFGS